MPKKIPMRQCLGCREMKPKKEMTRVVRDPDGTVSIVFRGKAPGRGAYICPSTECLRKALKSKALDRSLAVEIPQDINDALIAQMEHGSNE